MLVWLAACFGVERIQAQLPIEVSTEDRQRSEPEPDLAALNQLLPEYSKRHPRGKAHRRSSASPPPFSVDAHPGAHSGIGRTFKINPPEGPAKRTS
jgi:hypothetical protein